MGESEIIVVSSIKKGKDVSSVCLVMEAGLPVVGYNIL